MAFPADAPFFLFRLMLPADGQFAWEKVTSSWGSLSPREKKEEEFKSRKKK